MNRLETAVLRTLIYADVFEFPLTLNEIHFFLRHHEATTLSEIQTMLNRSSYLQKYLCQSHSYYALVENAHILERRTEVEAITRRLWPRAIRYGRWLAGIPFVRMVALTGALAARNPSHENDDFDYLIVTQPGRVWLARALSIAIVRIARLWGIEICPNYVLAEDQLAQGRQDLFMAHEIVQIVPIFDEGIREQFFNHNAWTREYLPNARESLHTATPSRLGTTRRLLKRMLEWLLGGAIGDRLENWEYHRKLKRFATQAHQPESSAQIDRGHVKGHFRDHGSPILRQYHERLREYGLEEVGEAVEIPS